MEGYGIKSLEGGACVIVVSGYCIYRCVLILGIMCIWPILTLTMLCLHPLGVIPLFQGNTTHSTSRAPYKCQMDKYLLYQTISNCAFIGIQ